MNGASGREAEHSLSGNSKIRALLIIEQCNPQWESVPLEGYRYYDAIRRLVDVTLVTHERNRAAMTRAGAAQGVVFIPESPAVRQYFRAAGRIVVRGGRVNWPVLHVLGYPVYAEFNRRVFRSFREPVLRGDYDVVHAFSPIVPRYPVKLIDACENTPFILGPVNGGLSFPRGFERIARKEFSQFNFLRTFAQWLPGYRQTYRKATKILAGSSATLSMLRQQFGISGTRIELFHENGITASFFGARRREAADRLRLLFVGRLVPFKCADVVIDALARLPSGLNVTLTIVGDGPERALLERQVQRLGLQERVQFAGWVPHDRIEEYYHRADVFCFPSIREFGGAVVLEAMAAGLPCIVADYGGIAEYVTDGSGFRITPRSREHLIVEMARCIGTLAQNGELRARMSGEAVEQARAFEWGRKALRIAGIYANLVEQKHAAAQHSR